MTEHLPSDQQRTAVRRVVRAMFTPAELDKFNRFNAKTGAVHTAREILIAAADIAGQLGDEQTAATLESLAEHERSREVYPL